MGDHPALIWHRWPSYSLLQELLFWSKQEHCAFTLCHQPHNILTKSTQHSLIYSTNFDVLSKDDRV